MDLRRNSTHTVHYVRHAESAANAGLPTDPPRRFRSRRAVADRLWRWQAPVAPSAATFLDVAMPAGAGIEEVWPGPLSHFFLDGVTKETAQPLVAR